MIKHLCRGLGWLGCASAMAWPAAAQGNGPVVIRNDDVTTASPYWTPEHLRGARPYPLPGASETRATSTDLPAATGGPSTSSPFGRPTYSGAPLNVQPHAPLVRPDTAAQEGAAARSTSCAPFRSSRRGACR
jgi:hypothetical protein